LAAFDNPLDERGRKKGQPYQPVDVLLADSLRSCCEEIFVLNLPLLSARARKDVEPKERRNLLRASC
jgi:hypothetical protein